MNIIASIWVAGSLLISPSNLAGAQETLLRDPRDKLVSASATGPAANWAGQPWWAPLSECAAAFALPTQDKAKFQKFAGHAMMRLADDRGLKAEQATGLILPWAEGRGRERAQTMSMAFGLDSVRSNCDALFAQYQATQ